MSNAPFPVRTVSAVFPTFAGKLNGLITVQLSCHLVSIVLIGAAFSFPAFKVLFMCCTAAVVLLSIVAGLSFGGALNRAVVGSVEGLSTMFASMDGGKGMSLAPVELKGEEDGTLAVREKYNEFLSSMRNLISEVRRTGIDIAVDAAKVSSSVITTAAMTARQSEISAVVSTASNEANSAISEVAESTQYVSGKTTENLAMAESSYKELVEVTNKTRQIALSVESFSSTVEELGNSSNHILQAVSVINDIAEQTNLLSLNATIEAARAAEHGKGFAVVAEEVRDLAKRIKPATEEITENINGMIELVERTQLETVEIRQYAEETNSTVNETSQNFNVLMDDFGEANEQLMKIAAAVEELATNNNEVTEKVEGINDFSTRIAGDMESSKASVETLGGVTEKMLEMVSRFRTGEGAFDAIITNAYEIRDEYQQILTDMKHRGVNLFDSKYQKVPDTEPQKYETSFTKPFRDYMMEYCDKGLKRFDGAIYCLAIDKNGYLPIHHSRFSQPMTGDPEKDLLYSRHQRIFLNNRAEKRRCSHTDPLLLQTYKRDTGEVLNDLSLPIFIDGRHWGATIIGFDPKVLLG